MRDRYLPIKDYAIIGDTQTAALVSRRGSIDWLCFPQFDSPSTFAALLDCDRGGHFTVQPAGEFESERRYLDQTAVLETTFRTDSGVLRVTDMFTVATRHAYISRFRPEHEVLRRIECLAGEVDVSITYSPRPDYARRSPHIERRDGHGFFETYAAQLLLLRSEIPLALNAEANTVAGVTRLRAGETRFVSLAFDREGPAVMPILGEEAERRVGETIAYWRQWSERCNYDGPHADAVIRSAITLKLLTYSESGAVIAAPTTSLPEWPGGVRNWDYRFCWPRDAAFTTRAFLELGFSEEAEAFVAWLTYATRRALPHLGIIYDLHGVEELTEHHLDHLEGYAGSRPVRVGNAAGKQFQMDVYGEVISACYQYVQRGGRLDRWQRHLLAQLGEAICTRWSEPDNGIWESRAQLAHHTFSKAMCWVGMDRLIRLQHQQVLALDVARFRRVQREIEDEIESRAYNERMQSYTSRFDGDRLDASLLLMALYGYARADSVRMKNTFEKIRACLGRGPLLYRYLPDGDDGFPPGEGAFGVCGFWAVEYLLRLGKIDEADDLFTALLAHANDVGLFSEEIDVETGAALGNFPQAYTHVGVINAALTMAEARGTRPAEFVEDEGEIARITV